MSLDRLPLLVVDTIFDHLPRSNVFALSLTNRALNAAVSPWRFDRVRLRLRGFHQFQTDLKRWDEILSVDGRHALVRRFMLAGDLHATEHQDEVDSEEQMEHEFDTNFTYPADEANSRHSEWRVPPRPLGRRYSYPDDLAPAVKQQVEDSWSQLLVEFVKRLPNLTDVYFRCNPRISPILLETLSQYNPPARLHTSLLITAAGADKIDPYQFSLATSPCLYRISCASDGLDNPAYVEKVIMEMVAGKAPNLKRVSLYGVEYYGSIETMNRTRGPRPTPPPPFFPEGSAPLGRGSLQSLDTKVGFELETLQGWERHTRLELLESLKIKNAIKVPTISYAAGLAMSGKFASLTTLHLGLATSEHAPELDQIAMDTAASELLSHLPPRLQDVKLTGFVKECVFHSLIRRHGSTLLKVWLTPSWAFLDDLSTHRFLFSSAHIHEMATRCPNLETLHIHIPRTGGDREEVAIYRGLGKLPRLQRLSLHLDCSQPLADYEEQAEPTDDMFSHRISRTNIRKMYVDAAVDERLAISIFETVSSPSLQWAKLRVDGAGDFGSGGCEQRFGYIMKMLGGSYNYEKTEEDIDTGSGSTPSFRIEEVGKKSRIEAREDLDKWPIWPGWVETWNSVWPRKAENMMDDWSSFPLDRA